MYTAASLLCYTLTMKFEDRDDFVDLVAQAVIDRIEERDRIAGLVEMVVSRVIAMQKEEAARTAGSVEAAASTGDRTSDEDGKEP